jgi:predicted nucleotidyltransferase component of viral defense system
LHKLLLAPAARYSEDLDFVQIKPSPIGPVLDRLRARLNPWLGEPRTNLSVRGATLVYRFESEQAPVIRMRLKIEINTREHFQVHPLQARSFAVETRWFSGTAEIPLYAVAEMLGTKLRALYQRRKGRDLFDLWHSHTRGVLEPDPVVAAFRRYMDEGGQVPGREIFLENLRAKLKSPAFLSDTPPLLRPEIHYDPSEAAAYVEDVLLVKLP